MRPRSRWILASCLLSILAGFQILSWDTGYSSGIERFIGRAVRGMVCAATWLLALLTLVIGAWRRRRAKPVQRAPILALLLCLASGLSIWWITAGRITPERFVRAAETGDTALVRRGLARGIDVDATYDALLGFGGSRRTSSALGAAAAAGQLEVLDVLLDAGADKEHADPTGATPIDLAVSAGQLAAVERLLAAGASLAHDFPDSTGRPARESTLFIAMRGLFWSERYPEPMLALLVEHGVETDAWQLDRIALWWDDPERSRRWFALARSREAERSEWSGVLESLTEPSSAAAVELHRGLRSGSPGSGPDDRELLQLAAKWGRRDFLAYLLENGLTVETIFDPALPGGGGALPPLHHAILSGQVETVRWLIARGADPLRRDGTWGTMLHRACYADEPEIVALLLEQGADVNAPLTEALASTPLFSAAENGSLEVARILVEAGARTDVRDLNRWNAAQRARARGHDRFATYLETL